MRRQDGARRLQDLPVPDLHWHEGMPGDVLAVSNGGATITQIMFKAYMSHCQAKGYISQLIERGFLEFDPIDRKHDTAPREIEYLQAAEKISVILSITTRRSVSRETAFQF
jgi:predicted transcriptional regulator